MYGSVKSSLLSRDLLLTLDEAYKVLTLDEESKLVACMNEEWTEGVSFSIQTAPRSCNKGEKRGSYVKCTFCGKRGHVAKNFFCKIGYPPWWDERGRNGAGNGSGHGSSNQNGDGRGSHTSHVKRRGPEPARVNHVFEGRDATSILALASHICHSQITAADRVGLTGLNDVQWKTLFRLLKEHKPSPSERMTWSVDF